MVHSLILYIWHLPKYCITSGVQYHWLQNHQHDPAAALSWLICSPYLLKVLHGSSPQVSYIGGQNLTLHLLSLGSHSTRQMCHPRNLSCWRLPSSWHHLSGSYLIIGRDITKKVCMFSVKRKEIERLPCNSLCGLQTDCLNGILIKSSFCERLFYFSFGVLCINN